MSTGRRPRREPPPTRFVLPNPLVTPAGTDLVALGADLAPGTLLAAYRAGMFPMPVDPGKRRSKVAWYSPDPRGLIPLDGLKISKSLRKSVQRYEVRVDTDFRGVMERCADPDRAGRWITTEFLDAYEQLFDLGWAQSYETYLDGLLVGGLYGIRINNFFAGESMFHDATDASKVALVHLVDQLNDSGATLLDTQWLTHHLVSLGGYEVSRLDYLCLLAAALD
jgi:leucyl/phenylalanyl-tRNA---protein transferase